MSIRVVCPNGHALQVKSELAGKTGLCPVCKAHVQIPTAEPQAFSEDSIMGLLGGAAPAESKAKAARGASSDSGIARPESQKPPKKNCIKCKREVPIGTTICPHCHTFIGNLNDS